MSDTWVATLKSWAAAVLASADMNQEIRDRAHVLSLAVDGDTSSTAISFSGERWDNDNMWVIGAPTRLTIQHTGLYAIGGSVQWAANATGRRYLSIVANAATNLGGTPVDEADSGSEG